MLDSLYNPPKFLIILIYNEIIMKKLLVYSLLILQCFVLFSQKSFTSPDGKKRVFIHKLPGGQYQVTVNSNAHNDYRRIAGNQVYFFTDSLKVAYIAKCDDGYCIVIDGIEGPHNNIIHKNEIKFSPDRTHYAYMAFNNNKWFYIIDGIKEPEYDGIISTGITFSPDSKQWAYAAFNNGEWFYIVNGIEQPHYKQVAAEGIIFSADSKHWAYGAEKENTWICISDGKEPPHEGSGLCSSYKLPTTSPSTDNSYFEIGFVSCHSKSLMGTDSDFQDEDNIKYAENNGIVILPNIHNNYGFNIIFGAQSIYKKFGMGMEFNYTLLFPDATWNNVDVNIRYYSFFDYRWKFIYLPVKGLSLDLTLGLNLATRMKIENGSFQYDDNDNIISTEDVKLKGGIFKGFPFNVLGGIGVSYKITPKLIISANTYARYVLFTKATGAMGKNKELKGGFISGGIFDWVNDPNLMFQISTRLLLD
jgi:hypothetical protein